MHSAWTNRRFKTMVFPAKENGYRLLPHDGIYRITVDAEALHTADPAGYELLKHLKLDWEPTPNQRPQFGFFLRRPLRSITPNIDQRVATFELEHNERKTMTIETWLPGGQYTLAINFDTGPRMDIHRASAMFHLLREKETVDPQELKDVTAKVRKDRSFRATAQTYLTSLPFPRIRFHSIMIEGPLEDVHAPTKEYLTHVDSDPETQRRELSLFARKALRRPISSDELASYIEYAKKNGYRGAVKAMLCSPAFLFLHEKSGQLDDHALASRLSYFLWNSMPDTELFAIASKGNLRTPSIMQEQLARMLADPKADSFFDRFTYQWLGLDNMDDMRASKEFTFYHDFFVRDLMKEETSLFFGNLVRSNAPVSDLVHADYTFMNGALARHYGIDRVKGSTFEKVSLTEMPRRRGLLGQGAVLTTSANGIDTSPVIRGIWVLDHLLGTPPSPPPSDVEVLEPDTRGTKTLREMYAAHRTDASCNRCHKDIDPLGFALENFDPIGRWRDEYKSGLQVDSTGQMPGGQTFENIEGLRSLLKGSVIDLVAKNLVHRLLICATGRELSVADNSEIEAILQTHKEGGYRANDLLFYILTSEIFLNK